MLHGSQDYKFVVTEDFGIVSSYAPRTVFGDVQTMVVVSTMLIFLTDADWSTSSSPKYPIGQLITYVLLPRPRQVP